MAPFFGGFQRLAVNDHRAGMGLPLGPQAHLLAQAVVDRLPHPLVGQLAKVCVHRLPGQKVVRQTTPTAPRAPHIQDGIEHLALRVLARSARALAGQQRGDLFPFFVAQVTGVRFSLVHAPQCTTLSSVF